jgi:hypothetical protein
MPPDFSVLHVLRRHRVPFVVVGGHAVNFHGHRRATEDVDVVWLRSPDAERALVAALAEIGAHYISREIDPATGIEATRPATAAYVATTHLMMLWTPTHGFLDLFDFVPNDPAADVMTLFDSSVTGNDGLRYVSLAWLRRMKRAAGRPVDLADLENLPGEDEPDQPRTP